MRKAQDKLFRNTPRATIFLFCTIHDIEKLPYYAKWVFRQLSHLPFKITYQMREIKETTKTHELHNMVVLQCD